MWHCFQTQASLKSLEIKEMNALSPYIGINIQVDVASLDITVLIKFSLHLYI